MDGTSFKQISNQAGKGQSRIQLSDLTAINATPTGLGQ